MGRFSMTVMGVAAAALVLAAFPPSARAQRLLTWADCVELAIRQNPDLQSSRLGLEADKASYKGSWNGLMPSATLSNSYTDSNTAGPNKWTAGVNANLLLLDAGRIASIRASKALVGQGTASLRQVSANVRFNLFQAFAQVLEAERSVQVSRNIRDMRDRGAKLVELRYASGRESKGNMLRADAQLEQAEAELRQAMRAQRADQIALDRQLGIDDFGAVVATGTLAAAPPPPAPADDLALLSNRPDVALQEAVVRSAQASLSSARSTIYPSLSANYQRGRFGDKEFPSRAYTWSGGLTLSLPIFGGGPTATYYAVQAANRSLERAQQDLRVVRDAAIADLEQTWATYAGDADQVSVQHALVLSARQRNDEADVRYASGLLTYDNWEIIATDRINNERQVVTAEFNAAVSQAAWERSLGKELGE